MKKEVEEAKKGNMVAMEKLYLETVDGIHNYLYSMLNEKHMVDDLVSNVYKNVIANISSFQGKSSFKTWVFSIARNELYGYFRTKQKENSTSLNEEIAVEPKDEVDEKELEKRETAAIKEVEWLFAELPERYAEVLRLRYIANLTLIECAEALDITKNNVKVLLNRARKKAAKLIKDKNE